jgi:ketosteroid isomerase-like protein
VAEQNIQIVRQAFDYFARGDIDALISVCDRDVEVYEEPELPDSRVWRGHQGAREYYVEAGARWSEFNVEPREFVHVDDSRVLVLGVQRGRGSLSGAQVESSFGHIYELRSGKLVRAAFYLDEQRALEVAGLVDRSGRLG